MLEKVTFEYCFAFFPKCTKTEQGFRTCDILQTAPHRLTAGKYQMSHPQQGSMRFNLFPFPISCCCRSVARSHTQSATVFLLRLTFKNACLLSDTISQTCIMQFLTNSPSVKGRDALAISTTTI